MSPAQQMTELVAALTEMLLAAPQPDDDPRAWDLWMRWARAQEQGREALRNAGYRAPMPAPMVGRAKN